MTEEQQGNNNNCEHNDLCIAASTSQIYLSQNIFSLQGYNESTRVS